MVRNSVRTVGKLTALYNKVTPADIAVNLHFP